MLLSEREQANRQRALWLRAACRAALGRAGGTGIIYALVLAGFFLAVRHSVAPAPPRVSLVIDLFPLASPPIEEKQVKPAPEKIEKQPPKPLKIQSPEPVSISIAVHPVPASSPAQAVVDPGPKEPETVAPKATPAPAASSNAPDTWEGQLLAALKKDKRHPVASRGREQSGLHQVLHEPRGARAFGVDHARLWLCRP